MFCFDNNYFLEVGHRFKVWFTGSHACIWLSITRWSLSFFTDYNAAIIGKGTVFENFGVTSSYFECEIPHRPLVRSLRPGVRNSCCSADESLLASHKLKLHRLTEWVANRLRDCLTDCEWLTDRLSDWRTKFLTDWMKERRKLNNSATWWPSDWRLARSF